MAWVDADYEPGTPDGDHLERSSKEDCIIVSNDADFARLHDEYDHGGSVLYDDQNASMTDFVAGLARIERFVPASDLRGNMV